MDSNDDFPIGTTENVIIDALVGNDIVNALAGNDSLDTLRSEHGN